ncbi:MAG: site-specific integrase, partial [Armatimonadota bacterium]
MTSRKRGWVKAEGPNRWRIVLSITNGSGGRLRPSHYFTGSRADAEKERTRLLREIDTGQYIPPSEMTVGSFLSMWLTEHGVNLAERTLQGYTHKITRYVVPEIGGLGLIKLQPLHIQRVYNRWRKESVSDRTLLQLHRILHRAFGHAVKWQYLNRNIIDSVDAPSAGDFRGRSYSVEEVLALLKTTEGRSVHMAIVLAIYTGLRRGEICGLQWSDIDKDARALTVRRSLYTAPDRTLKAKVPKSGKMRSVPLTSELIETLDVHKAGQVGWQRRNPDYNKGGWVVAGRDGNPLTPDWISQQFRHAITDAGIAPGRFHDLRHTLASWLIEDGEPLKVVSQWL